MLKKLKKYLIRQKPEEKAAAEEALKTAKAAVKEAKGRLLTEISQKSEVMLDNLRKNLAERYKAEGVDQPRYPVETPVYNGFARFVWLGLGSFIFGGIIMFLSPVAVPTVLLGLAGMGITGIFIGAHWTKEISDKTEKMGASQIRPEAATSDEEKQALKEQQDAKIKNGKTFQNVLIQRKKL